MAPTSDVVKIWDKSLSDTESAAIVEQMIQERK